MPLGARAFDLLLALASRRDRVVSKAELLDLAWPGLVVEENNLSVQISTLRKALGNDSIATVTGRGYRFTLSPGKPAASIRSDPADRPVQASRPAPLRANSVRLFGREPELVCSARRCSSTAWLPCWGPVASERQYSRGRPRRRTLTIARTAWRGSTLRRSPMPHCYPRRLLGRSGCRSARATIRLAACWPRCDRSIACWCSITPSISSMRFPRSSHRFSTGRRVCACWSPARRRCISRASGCSA